MKAKTVKLKLKIFALCLGLIYFTSCSQHEFKESIIIEDVSVTDSYNTVSDSDQTMATALINLKIIKSANVRYKVKKVKTATASIKQLARIYNAYISDLRFENNKYSLENRFTVKIPQQHFDAMMDSMTNIAEFVDHENITTKDVTEEYIDIETRLKTKLEIKKRYESILRKNAKTIEDILATEEKLGVIQEEIEASQGKLKYLSNKVAFSTIQIDLYQTVDYKEEPEVYSKTFLSKSKEGLTFGWDLIEALILGVIYIWPLLLIGLLIAFLIRRKIYKKSND